MSDKCFLCGGSSVVKGRRQKPAGIEVFCKDCERYYVIADGSVAEFCLNEDKTELIKTLSGRAIKDEKSRLIDWVKDNMRPAEINETNPILNPKGK